MRQQNPFLDAVVREMETKGERVTLLDRAHDRGFCTLIGVDYSAVDVYTQIKAKVMQYMEVATE